MRTGFSIELLHKLVVGFVVLGTLAVLVAWSPGMPAYGLDNSWKYAMGQSVAQGLVFGRDVIFTFGPYAAVDTHEYHPATAAQMLAGSLLFVSALAAGIATLAWHSRRWAWAVFTPAILVLLRLSDPLFFVLPWLYVLIAGRIALAEEHPDRLPLGRATFGTLILLVAALALSSLVKGTFAIGACIALGLSVPVLWKRDWRWATGTVLSYLSALAGLWVSAGQPIADLPGFFRGLGPIVSGYSEAMATAGPASERNHYLLAAMLVASTAIPLYRRRGFLVATASALSLLLTLLLAFKAGYVRQDGHVLMSAGALLLIGWFMLFDYRERLALVPVFVCFAGWFFIDRHRLEEPVKKHMEDARMKFRYPIDGFVRRFVNPGGLNEEYRKSREAIRFAYPLPAIAGTVDIYSHDQARLFASKLSWSPRPVIQSYSAYTPELARLNAEHLAGPRAAQTLLFAIQPIDGRLASLEDGLSWPVMLSRYAITGRVDEYLVLSRKKEAETAPSDPLAQPLLEARPHIGQSVSLPQTGELLWAKLEIEPTLKGRLLAKLFRLPALKLTYTFPNGTQRRYRFISEVGKSGFLLAPVVAEEEDFLALASSRRRELLAADMPATVSLDVADKDRSAWENDYRLSLYSWQPPVSESVDAQLFEASVPQLPPPIDAYPRVTGGVCMFDSVNGKPAGPTIETRGVVSVNGWAAVDPKAGRGAERLFVTLHDGSTTRFITPSVTPRNDVKQYFKHPEMADMGFSAKIELGKNGYYELGVAQVQDGKVFMCVQKKKLLSSRSGGHK
ncbi:MAG: hypothetical protein HYV16_03120 [Gammaproteobacteria bacterium]|nr:hypothetical protein [Gammaproteobacteria bacterium]